MSDSLRPHGLQPTRLLRPWDFPNKSTGVGCHCLLRDRPQTGINLEVGLVCARVASPGPRVRTPLVPPCPPPRPRAGPAQQVTGCSPPPTWWRTRAPELFALARPAAWRPSALQPRALRPRGRISGSGSILCSGHSHLCPPVEEMGVYARNGGMRRNLPHQCLYFMSQLFCFSRK